MVKKLFYNPIYLAGILSLLVLIITAQSILTKPKTFDNSGLTYTGYNNYVIFKQSHFHLIENKDLYQLYPAEHWDYYKYSPAFSLVFMPLAWLQDAIGLFIWNLLNALILFFALWKLPGFTDRSRLFMLGIILIELITSLQNSQSNGLMAGLILFAFIFLEKKKTALASLCIVSTVFIKLFGIIALALFVFYPQKYKAAAYTIGWFILFAILPLMVISTEQLSFLYQSWLNLLKNDHSASIGLSVAGWLKSWFNIESGNLILLTGAILFCLPLLKYKYFNELKFKLLFLSSILVWIVIFNHKAESPTFIIAVCGVAIWFFTQPRKMGNTILLTLVIIFTVFSPTDLFPKSIRMNYVIPYVLKAVPCILVWVKIMYDLMVYKPNKLTTDH
jgi:hypothetical protein